MFELKFYTPNQPNNFYFYIHRQRREVEKNKDLFGSMDSQRNFEGVHSKGKETLHSIWNEGMFEFLSK